MNLEERDACYERHPEALDKWDPSKFASYHLAAYGDAMRTATILGHKDPGVVHNHYKALVVKATALKFWELRPLETEVATPPNVQGTPK